MSPVVRVLVRLLLAMLVAATAGTVLAQPPEGRPDRRPDWGGERRSGEDRQRFREDLQRQQQYADPRRRGDPAGEERARRNAEWQRLSPEQREGIRRDMRDYNRDLDRRR